MFGREQWRLVVVGGAGRRTRGLQLGKGLLITLLWLVLGVPLVSGAAIRLEGQVTAFSGQPGDPCYQCLYPRDGDLDETCSANGVLAPVVGIVGSIQATEAIKILTGLGVPLFGRLLLLDAATMDWRRLRLGVDPACPVCSGRT